MSRNVTDVPRALWEKDLKPDWQCELYTGRMVGSLQPMKTNAHMSKLTFELHDPDDPTEVVLRYNTYEAPAEELARWEGAGDLVGIVVAWKGQKMFMVMAYNFTRAKWFGTGYYPHVRDKRPFGEMTMQDSYNLTMLAVALICTCIGLLLLPIGLYANGVKSKQYQILNPTDYRGDTARRIAAWIKANEGRLALGGDADSDISL